MIRSSVLVGCAAIALCLVGCTTGAPSASPAPAGSSDASSTPATASSAPAPQPGTTSGIPSDCPTSAAVSSALGVTVPDPQVTKEDDALTCLYLSTTAKDGAIVMYQKAPAGTDANTLKAAAAAKTDDQQVTQVDGIGDIAFVVNGQSGYAIVVLSAGIELTVAGGTTADSVKNLARTLLG